MADRVPVRTCVGCRQTRPQPELVRFHLDKNDRLRWARNGSGRGAWVCSDSFGRCFGAAADRKAFGRALRRTPDPDSISSLCDEWPSLDQQ